KQDQVTIVSVDGGCTGVRGVKAGQIAATSQQYPLKMASMGVAAVVRYAKTGAKPHGYTDTGVTLITNKPVAGVPSKGVAFGLALISLTAGIDRSNGAVMALRSSVMTKLAVASGVNPDVAIALGIGVCGAFGLLNGALVTGLRLPAFIVTLGTLNIAFALTH